MGFSGQRPMRRSRAKALNYGGCGGGQIREHVAQGFNPALRLMALVTPFGKELLSDRLSEGLQKGLEVEKQG